MVTACHSCDHAAACRNCPKIGTAVCLKCQHGNRNKDMPGPFCWTCKRSTEHDDIRIRHSAHNRDELTRSTINPPSKPCTALPEKVEDTLRRFLCTITGLDPLEIVAALHIARRGTSRTVAAAIENYAAAIRTYHGGRMSRAAIKEKWKALTRAMPELAAAKSWGKERGGRSDEE